jgi:hypothetical protein
VTLDDIHSENSTINGIGAWSEKGIIGRGVLLDYEAWREEHNHPLKDAFKSGAITLSELKAVAEWEGVEIKFGDILIIRSGYMAQYYKRSRDEIEALSKILPPTFLGVEQSEDVLRWIWDNFSAVAGDQPSFECWRTFSNPFSESSFRSSTDVSTASSQPYMLHEVLLAGWGCPIGELFDLEALSVQCKKNKRYSFFVASEPCNVCFPTLRSQDTADWKYKRYPVVWQVHQTSSQSNSACLSTPAQLQKSKHIYIPIQTFHSIFTLATLTAKKVPPNPPITILFIASSI